MSSDRELLELAAKAAGYEVAIAYQPDLPRCLFVRYEDKTFTWMPLIDDGDALRLAVKLGLRIDIDNGINETCWKSPNWKRGSELHNDDAYAATRRAIVKAAANIGETM